MENFIKTRVLERRPTDTDGWRVRSARPAIVDTGTGGTRVGGLDGNADVLNVVQFMSSSRAGKLAWK
jgi:hypothetical protein